MAAIEVPERMLAAIWSGPGLPLSVETVPTPRLARSDDVLIRVRCAMFGAALVRALTTGHPKLSPPAVLGTLVAGEVAAVGPAVRHLVVGQRVTIDPHPPCGECADCRDELSSLCVGQPGVEPGAHAQYVRLRPPLTEHIMPLSKGFPYHVSMLTEIVACVLEATDIAEIGPGRDVLVLGCGPVALIQVQLARLRGADRVYCAVNHPSRCPLVSAFGGIPIAASNDLAERVRYRTGGRGAHVVIEMVGSAGTYQTAFDAVRNGGVVVGFGGCPPGTTITLDPNEIHYRRLKFVGSYHYRPGVFDAAAQMLEAGDINLEPLITHRIPLEQIADAARIAAGPDCLILVVEP